MVHTVYSDDTVMYRICIEYVYVQESNVEVWENMMAVPNLPGLK